MTVQKTKKLKRIGLLGMAQTPKHSVFRLEKKRHTVDAIRAFLQTIGFASWDSARLYSPLGGGDMGRPERKYTSTAYDDKYFSIPKGQYTVDVFFGKELQLALINLKPIQAHYAAIREDIMGRQSIVSTMISGRRTFKD